MARPLRIEYPGAWYHITCRGNERRSIFTDDEDRRKFLEILGGSTELYNVEVHIYVLMNNHFHLVVKTLAADLQRFMQRFNTTYTVYFNKRHKRIGHLFQGRYKAILIDADGYLLALSRYAHLNPVWIKDYSQRSIKEKLEILARYEWSSYAGYIHVRRRQSFVCYGMVLGMLSGRDDRRGRKAYERFVVEGIAKEMRECVWEGVRGQVVLGSESFVDYIYERFLSGREVNKREQPGIEEIELIPKSIEEISNQVARVYGITDEGELYLRRSSQRQARSVFIELSRRYLSRKMSMTELGRKLGNISGAAISLNMKRLEVMMKNDNHLHQKFQRLEKDLKMRSQFIV